MRRASRGSPSRSSSPSEYKTPNHVDAALVDALAAWILATAPRT